MQELHEIKTENIQPEMEKVSIKEEPSTTPSQKSQSPNRTPNHLVKEESIDEENMDLDFEEISEDELEEEARVKGLGDALGVDWASLVAESRPRIKPVSSAKRRWESHNVLVNLGVSVEMAGEELVKDILKEHAEVKLQEQQENAVEKTDTVLNGTENETVKIKTEVDEESVVLEGKKESAEVSISHPVAGIQVAIRENQAIRKTLFASAGPYRRALSARRDLVIRRHLSHLPIKDTYIEAPKRHDPKLLQLAMQLFERCL